MSNNYQIYLISDSTGETLDRIFTAIKAQFTNISYKIHTYSFTRTENQIDKILFEAEKNPNSIILYSIVDSSLAKYLAKISDNKEIPCFGVLGDLILSFSKLLNQKASHQPSGQYELNDEYYKRISAIQLIKKLPEESKTSNYHLLNLEGRCFMASGKKVHPSGFEPETLGLEGRCSIQLSYGRLFLVDPVGLEPTTIRV